MAMAGPPFFNDVTHAGVFGFNNSTPREAFFFFFVVILRKDCMRCAACGLTAGSLGHVRRTCWRTVEGEVLL